MEKRRPGRADAGVELLKRSEGERAFDENPPLRSQRCLDVFAESQTRHNEGKVYDGQSKLVSPKKAISKEI